MKRNKNDHTTDTNNPKQEIVKLFHVDWVTAINNTMVAVVMVLTLHNVTDRTKNVEYTGNKLNAAETAATAAA